MADMDPPSENEDHCAFDTLFTNNVPHLLETIFFSLDYASFKSCLEVKSTWNELLTSEPFKKRARTLFQKEIQKRKDEKSLQHESRKGNAEEVRKLISSGILDVNCLIQPTVDLLASSYCATPLCLAARGGHKEVVQILLDVGAECDKADTDGYTPLHMAVRFGHKDVVKLFLDRGADPNMPDKIRYTPLHTAVRFDYIDVAKLLMDAGAEIMKKDMLGHTPLFSAAGYGHKDLAILLLDAGSDPNTTDIIGWSPLQRAAKEGYSDIIKRLLIAGADVDQVNIGWYERTALFYAAKYGHIDAVKILLDEGADCNKSDELGYTPLQLAVKVKDNHDVVKMLQEREDVP